MLRGLVATSDNSVMVMVNFFEPSGGPPYNQYRSYITKIDGNGDEEWTNYYQFKEGNDEVHYVNHFYDIRETGDPVKFIESAGNPAGTVGIADQMLLFRDAGGIP